MAAIAKPQDIGPQPQPQRPHLRLVQGDKTNRQRVLRERRVLYGLVAVAFAAILAVAVAGISAASSWISAEPGVESPPAAAVSSLTEGEVGSIYVVEPGDTLWSVAAAVTDGDPRPVVDELASRTGGADLQPGQRIALDGL